MKAIARPGVYQRSSRSEVSASNFLENGDDFLLLAARGIWGALHNNDKTKKITDAKFIECILRWKVNIIKVIEGRILEEARGVCASTVAILALVLAYQANTVLSYDRDCESHSYQAFWSSIIELEEGWEATRLPGLPPKDLWRKSDA